MTERHLPLKAGRSAFGADPAGYHAARPDYPEALYQRLDEISPIRGASIFEVGSGTGIATRRLLEFGPRTLTAIEPDERLADYLQSALASRFSQLEIARAVFEEVDLQAASFDLGIAATSLHWLDQDLALAKVVCLLRPGGWWAMCWNIFTDPDRPSAFARASEPLWRALSSSRSWPSGGRPAFGLDEQARLGEMRRAGLSRLGTEQFHRSSRVDTASVLSLTATFSQVSQADPQDRATFLASLGELIDQQFGGIVERQVLTAVYYGQKPPIAL